MFPHQILVEDGINNATAMASSHVGVAIGGGVGAASEVASIVLMGNKLSQVGIPIAAGALLLVTGMMLTPSIAGALMGLSSIGVMTNSLLLSWLPQWLESKVDERYNLAIDEKFIATVKVLAPSVPAAKLKWMLVVYEQRKTQASMPSTDGHGNYGVLLMIQICISVSLLELISQDMEGLSQKGIEVWKLWLHVLYGIYGVAETSSLMVDLWCSLPINEERFSSR